jgi:sugar phosphate isomerase/epimerase
VSSTSRVLGAGDLVLCAGTLPREVSYLERLEAAASAGFAGISIWGRDIAAARAEGRTDADIRSMLADHGLAVAELDPAWWWLPGADEIGRSLVDRYDDQQVFAFGEEDMFSLADLVGARSLNAVDVFGGEWGVDDAAEAFAGLCDRAADHGLLIHLEFLPWSRIPDAMTAWEIVRRAGRQNGGLAVDAWHFVRSGNDLAALGAVPPERVLGIQLDDGPLAAEADLVAATLHDRLLPGEGEFDLVSLCRALKGSPAPVGVEVFSDALHALGPLEAARRAADATRAVLAKARSD